MINPESPFRGGPADAYAQLVATCKHTLNEVARRRRAEMPGLLEHCEDNVVVIVGGTSWKVRGTFQYCCWRHEGMYVDEIFLNADRRRSGRAVGLAEDVLVTLIHEATRAWNSMNNIRDCSNRGRYHDRRFAEPALQLGLVIEPHPTPGHATPALQGSSRAEFADLLSELDGALIIVREPETVVSAGANKATTAATTTARATTATPLEDGKYVSAACGCVTGRGQKVTFRMARGSWRSEVPIWCSACGQPFSPSLNPNWSRRWGEDVMT